MELEKEITKITKEAKLHCHRWQRQTEVIVE